jgi:transposase-like protein
MKSRTKRNSCHADRSLHSVTSVQVQLSLPVAGVLRDVKSAFMGLCIEAGKGVLAAMMESERSGLCGAKGVPNADRTAVRGGSTHSSVTLGGRRIGIVRVRARDLIHGELALPSYLWATDRDPLEEATLAAIAAGVSTRRYGRALDRLPAGQDQSAVSKSAVSRRFVALSSAQLKAWLSAPIPMDLPVIMIDGVHYRDSVVLVCLGFDSQGKKHVLGIREGSTEKTEVVRALLAELIDRGLAADVARLWVIDGGKALRRAILETFGIHALVHRCQEHKRRNVLGHLPESMQPSLSKAMRDAWEGTDPELAKRQLDRLAQTLKAKHPGAAASLAEGLEETFTLMTLGVRDTLYRSLRTTNPIENLNGSIAHYCRNVRRWKDASMILRWVAFSLREASHGFRALRGFRDIKALVTTMAARVQKQAQRKVA